MWLGRLLSLLTLAFGLSLASVSPGLCPVVLPAPAPAGLAAPVDCAAPAVDGTRVAVLIYHAVCPDNGGLYTVSPSRLRADLEWLLDQGWRPLDFDTFVAWHAGETTLAGDHFLLSFDDGYQGIADHALDVLRDLDIPAVLFLTTGDLDRGTGLTTPGARTLIQSGLFGLQNHSHDLHRQVAVDGGWVAATCVVSPAELAADVSRASEIIEELGAPSPIAFAWPYGEHTPAATGIVSELLPLQFGTQEALVQPGDPLIGRFGMDWRSHQAVRRLLASLPDH